ncbi:ATP-binding cassette domain-containing protein, partial [Candidatus Bathyarchaeota archaeon]|nr:ATP-binding cassette domain-containing protein [Candidatus Bathyarchaeota archaeon]
MPVVYVENLHKTFKQGSSTVSLFNGLSFRVDEGEFIAVTGPSGTGKTTLINLLAGLDRPTKGTIKIFGRDISSLSQDEMASVRARSIGILFQTCGLVSSLNVKENIRLSQEISGRNGSDMHNYLQVLIDFFGLQDKADLDPRTLSFGEVKKAGIARALAAKPEILLLDEPTGNLDPPSVNVILPFLKGLRYIYGKTIIMTTNSPRAAKLANREVQLGEPQI